MTCGARAHLDGSVTETRTNGSYPSLQKSLSGESVESFCVSSQLVLHSIPFSHMDKISPPRRQNAYLSTSPTESGFERVLDQFPLPPAPCAAPSSMEHQRTTSARL